MKKQPIVLRLWKITRGSGSPLRELPHPWPTVVHSMSSLKQQGEQVRLDDGNIRQITQPGMRLESQSAGLGLGGLGWQQAWESKNTFRALLSITCDRSGELVSLKSARKKKSAGVKNMLMFNAKICTVLKLLPGPLLQGINYVALEVER